MALYPRPKELKLAVTFASLALLLSLVSTMFNREQIGEGWIVWLFLQALFSAIYALFLIFSYNGRGWVRYFMLIIYAFGYGRVAVADHRLFLDPFVIIVFLLSVAAIVYWFMPSTNRWYKNPRSIEITPS
jgi:hypothetical protein